MAYETFHRMPGAVSACDSMSAAKRLRPPTTAMSRAKMTTPKPSETSLSERRATSAAANEVDACSEIAAKGSSSRRAARIAKEQELAAFCHRRASLWANAIRNGFDPDIARFVRDQAAAWHLLATNYARSAADAPGGQADAH